MLDPQDNPLPDAIVYLTNTRTRAVKTYIVGADGTYRFPALSTAIDYEVYAQYKNFKSDTKSVSQFDDRSQVYLDLKVNTEVRSRRTFAATFHFFRVQDNRRYVSGGNCERGALFSVNAIESFWPRRPFWRA